MLILKRPINGIQCRDGDGGGDGGLDVGGVPGGHAEGEEGFCEDGGCGAISTPFSPLGVLPFLRDDPEVGGTLAAPIPEPSRLCYPRQAIFFWYLDAYSSVPLPEAPVDWRRGVFVIRERTPCCRGGGEIV